MSIADWKPSAPLASATVLALQALSRQWPRAMSMANETSEAGQAFMADYAFAMKGADLRAIPLAARAWVGDHNMPPRPADLATLAREISAAEFPTRWNDTVRPISSAQSIDHLKDQPRIDMLGQRALAVLGSWLLVAHVWASLLETAQHDDQRLAVREGHVPYDVFDGAVAAVQRGRRASGGPMASTLRSAVG